MRQLFKEVFRLAAIIVIVSLACIVTDWLITGKAPTAYPYTKGRLY